MNAQSNAFGYDDFEQYLLDAAKIDRAPSDLPARLGVALGLGMPVLAAAEVASVAPMTTSLSSGATAAEFHGAATSKGLVAALKASFGAGSSTLWSTAAKGIAVGVLSGAALVGSGQAIVSMTDSKAMLSTSSSRRGGFGPSASDSRKASGSLAANSRFDVAPPAPKSGMEATPDEASPDEASSDGTSPLPVDAGHASSKRRLAAQFAGIAGSLPNVAPADDDPNRDANKKDVRRLARPIFPEKTTAVARYPLIYDDVSALYDTPTKHAAPAPVPTTVAPEPTVDSAVLKSLRTKTLAQARTLLGQSKAALALTELERFRKRVGERNFGVDEYLLRIESLANLGRAKEAQADVAHVERLAPNSAALRQAQMLARSRFVR